MNSFAHRSQFLTCKNKFLPQPKFSQPGQILTLREQFFTAVIDVWPHANFDMVTNNLTNVIEVALIDDTLSEALLYSLDY